VGARARAEVIVTHGNAGGRRSSADIDINGNGLIDPDEDRVRSLPARLGLTVPASVPDTAEVVLSDTVQDIVTTGTVTFSSPVFDLGPYGGTVTVSVDGGADGGTITNCAYLTSEGQAGSSGGVDLEACDTQTVGAPGCSPGAPDCGWQDGDMVTYTQNAWGTPTTDAGVLLASYFDAVYFNAGGVLRVGGGYTMSFTSALAIFTYQPAVGTPGSLNADLSDPTSSASGQFGGEVVGLKLNIDFSDAGHTLGTTGLRFGDLTLCGFTGAQATLNGTAVRSFLATANIALGGGGASLPITELNDLAVQLNASFGGGLVSPFGQDHVVSGTCS
jgi:hypothetical protein